MSVTVTVKKIDEFDMVRNDERITLQGWDFDYGKRYTGRSETMVFDSNMTHIKTISGSIYNVANEYWLSGWDKDILTTFKVWDMKIKIGE